MVKSTLFSSLAYLFVGAMSLGLGVFVATQFFAPVYSNESEPMMDVDDPEVDMGHIEAEDTIEALGANVVDSSDPFADKKRMLKVEVQSFLEPYIYDGESRRDPFRPYIEFLPIEEISTDIQGPLLPLQRFDLDQLRLVGIMWGISEPRAMILDPNSEVHTVGRDERLGRRNGYIAEIREGEVVVVETLKSQGELVYSTRVLKIQR